MGAYKICILTSAHPPLDARIFYKEACSLRKAGYEVVLIAPYPGHRQAGGGDAPAGASGSADAIGKDIMAAGDRGSKGNVKAVDSGGVSPLEAKVGNAHGVGYPKEEIVEGIRIRYVPPFQKRIQRVLNLKDIYQAAVEEQADVYHFHDPDLIFTGLTLQKKLGKPVIYDVHEYYADSLKTRYWLPTPLRRTVAAVFELVEKSAARRFAGVFTVNHHMEDLFKKYNPLGASLFNFPLQQQFQFERPRARLVVRDSACERDNERYEVQGSMLEQRAEDKCTTKFEVETSRKQEDACDTESLSGNSKNVTEETSDDCDRRASKAPVILYLGGINKERGLEVILEAMPLVREKHPEAICQLVGPVELGDVSERFIPLESWLERGNVQVLGKVPYSRVPGILRSAQIALVPLLPTLNYTKAIPVKLIEYMAAGLPVVGSRFGYIEQILGEDECGRLAEPGDPESLAREICYLIENPAQALSYAQRGWDAFHEKYSWESEEKKLLAVYEEVLVST